MRFSEPRASYSPSLPPVCLSLLVINIAIHFFNDLKADQYIIHGHASYGKVIYLGEYWRLLTYQFLHADFFHLGFNMYALWAFGRYIEFYWKEWWKFLLFYLISGCAGALLYMALLHIGLLQGNPWNRLVGASGSIYAILVGVAVLAPNSSIRTIFTSHPMPLKTFALILLAVGVLVVLTNGHNAGGEAAHLGGALIGYILMKNSLLLRR